MPKIYSFNINVYTRKELLNDHLQYIHMGLPQDIVVLHFSML